MVQRMLRVLLFLFLSSALLATTMTGCASRNKKPKKATYIYRGDAPTITYSSEEETPGGPLITR